MKQEIMVVAMRRSGHHAVMRWIESLIDPSVSYAFTNDFTNEHTGKKEFGNPDVDFYMYNAEDCKPSEATNQSLARLRVGVQLKKVIVVRDHFNMFSSRLAARIADRDLFGMVGAISPRARRFYINQYNASKTSEYIQVIYNNWFLSKEYREQVAKELGFNNIDGEVINDVPKEGGGSSFDNKEYDGRGQEMKVLERYKNYLSNDRYVKFVSSSRLTSVYKEMFGEDETYQLFDDLKNKLSSQLL